MIRVAHIVAYPPFREGAGTVCYYNAQALRELGCLVTVYAPRRNVRPEDARLEFYRYMACPLSVGNAYLTPELLRLGQVDIVHLHFPFVLGSELLLLRLLATGTPLVLTYHNDLRVADGARRAAFVVYNRLLAPLILSRARKIAVTALDYAESSIFGPGIFRRRRADLIELGNGIDVELFRPGIDPAPGRARFGFGPDDKLLLFVSSLDRAHMFKGLPLLLDAMARSDNPALRLLVVGDGDMRPAYERLAVELGLAGRVRFAGHQPHSALPAYYAAGDIVAIPSPTESFGVALAEAMAAGRPVIGCDVPGVRTVVLNGETGFLIPPGDVAALTARINDLAGDPALRRAMGERGRDRVTRHYSWRIIGQRLLALYRQLLDEAPAAAGQSEQRPL